MILSTRLLTTMLGLMLSAASLAQVHITDAWVRATVPGQTASGIFLTLKADTDTRLVGAASSAAGVTQLHTMTLKDKVMHMNAIQTIDLPAGQAVALAAGGHHIMLMDLKHGLEHGKQLNLELRFKDAQGKRFTQTIQVPIVGSNPDQEGMGHGHMTH